MFHELHEVHLHIYEKPEEYLCIARVNLNNYAERARILSTSSSNTWMKTGDAYFLRVPDHTTIWGSISVYLNFSGS